MTTKPEITDEEVIELIQQGHGRPHIARTHQLGAYRYNRLKLIATRRGHSPEHDMVHTVPDGYHVKGTSTLYKDGKPALQWVKSSIDHERQAELMRHAVEAMCSEIPRAERVPKSPHFHNENLLNTYVVTDFHLGMMAWHEESGEDYDMQIAENLLMKWFEAAIDQSPNAATGLLANIGDFLHWDGLEAVTPAHRHILDADTRLQKVIRVAIRCIKKIVRMMLEKHDHVHMLMCDANHDEASEAWMRELFASHYEDEPRVTVDNSGSTFYCYEHGKVSLFYHHGHKKKMANIDDVFAAKFREVYGRTKYSYAHMGHLHQQAVRESNLMVIEQHRTLAAKDAYAAQHGYLSGRDAKVITYHKDFGEVSRLTISPEMLK